MSVQSGLKLDQNLESSFIKIMHECITKTFKSHKKFIEKEIHSIVKKITQIKANGTKGKEYLSEQLNDCIQQLENTRAKYNKLIEAEDYLFEVLKKRLNHLLLVIENQNNPEIMKDYFTKRLSRIIIDYLLRQNYFKSAQIYVEETQLKEFADIEVFEETYKIVSKLKNKDCQEALSWCNTHKTKLQKNKSQLEFKLRFQEFIEIYKQGDIKKSVQTLKQHINKYFLEQDSVQTGQHIQKACGLMALPEKDKEKNETYKKYTDEKRWQELEELFLKEAYQLYSLPLTPMIDVALQTGISVLKTEFCSSKNNGQCPICNEAINKLGHKLPYAHQTQTCIKCPVTGEIMNDQNPPLYLPTGYVISEKAYKQLEDEGNEELIKCPITNQIVSRNDVKKVYFI